MKINNHNKHIEVIILAGGRDFGRCPLASHFPTALWPVMGKPVLERLLCHLREQGIERATVCSNDDYPVLQNSIKNINSMKLKFLNESLPLGTAGCIRDAYNNSDKNSLLLIFPAGIISVPDINKLIQLHQKSKSAMTVIFNPNIEDGDSKGCLSDIYICEPEVIEFIPAKGYYDIKEGLIPAIVRAGKNIYSGTLTKSVNNFRGQTEYLQAIGNYLTNNSMMIDFPHRKYNGSKNIIIANSAEIVSTAKIYGPTVIMEDSRIAENAIIFGPTIIGRNVTVGQNSLVENSVLWDNSTIERNCEINNCVIDYYASVHRNKIVENRAVIRKQSRMMSSLKDKTLTLLNDKTNWLHAVTGSLFKKTNIVLPEWSKSRGSGIFAIQSIMGFILFCIFLWSYWPEFTNLWKIWLRSDEYSSGMLVPLISVYILWSRRHKISKCPIHLSMWGLFAFIAAQGIRILGTFYFYASAERLSIILSIFSLTLFLFGWQVLKKVFTVLLFLCLMLPLPISVHTSVMLPLQKFATTSAVFCLEMLGYAVTRDGNIIHLNGISVAVAEACNGLRMVTAFIIIIGLVVMLVQREWWEKVIVIISSIPIAIFCNTLRLTITAIAFTMLSGENLENFFHDFGGYLMMPLALGLVIFELWLLTILVPTTVTKGKQQVIIGKSNLN